MSRLTAPSYHTTSPFTFPKGHAISDKTLAERHQQPATAAILAPTADGYTNEDMAQSHHSEIPLHSQSRRPSFGYQNSGFRESPSRPVHRSYRYFVVVIPPSRLIQEHGQLGHTLSSGPPHRLSQGIIMPLFPTVSEASSYCFIRIDRRIDVRSAQRYSQRIQFSKHDRIMPLPSSQRRWPCHDT